MEILYIISGILIGFVIGFLIYRNKSGRLQVEINSLKTLLETEKNSSKTILESEKISAERALKDAEERSRLVLEERSKAYQSTLAQQKEYMNNALNSMQSRFDETVGRLKAEVTQLTSELLKKRQTEFETSSRESMAKILQPLENNINLMREVVADNTLRHSESSGRLDSNLRLVLEHSDAARKSAERLADALRGGGRIQGDWGETVLTELLESQGLEEGIHFDIQTTLRDGSGKAIKGNSDSIMRPDVVLHLDKVRDVIIDAKVSMSAFLDYMNAESEEKKEQALKNHIQSLENHVNELSRKDYSSFILPPKIRMNYVIMFVPNSSALNLAAAHKPGLWRKAMEKNVYIADEQTLYAALRIINMTWKQIAQAENHEKVYALANEMLDRVSVFLERFTKIGRQIDDARRSYDDALGKLKESGQSIPQTCRKLINLGASVKLRKGVDPSLFDTSIDNAITSSKESSSDNLLSQGKS